MVKKFLAIVVISMFLLSGSVLAFDVSTGTGIVDDENLSLKGEKEVFEAGENVVIRTTTTEYDSFHQNYLTVTLFDISGPGEVMLERAVLQDIKFSSRSYILGHDLQQ